MERNHYMPIIPAMDPSFMLATPKIETINNDGAAAADLYRLLSLEPPPHLSDLQLSYPPPPPPPPFLSGDLDLFMVNPLVEPPQKRFRHSPPLLENQNQNAGVVIRPSRIPTSEIARRRRSKIGDRMKAIQCLMPSERKVDTATMLEEAHKYVRFLEAQVTALQLMPVGSAGFVPAVRAGPTGSGPGLERLNRQQMLQVMVNSPAIQDQMCRRGLCVFSSEQLAALQRRAAAAVRRMML